MHNNHQAGIFWAINMCKLSLSCILIKWRKVQTISTVHSMYCRQWYLNVSWHCTGGWVGSFSPLVSSHLAQGGLRQMQEGNTSGTWSFEHWNLVTWASLSTGLQGEGAAVPWVFGRRAGYVIMYGCVRGGVICKHIACCVRGWTNVHQSPEASRGRGSTWILHSSWWRWRFLDTFDLILLSVLHTLQVMNISGSCYVCSCVLTFPVFCFW